MTPRIIGEMLDCLADGDPESIVSAGLSMILGSEVRCRINGKWCDVFVAGDLAKDAERVANIVLDIPTSDNDGGYEPGFHRFNSCHVYAVVAAVWRRGEQATE